MRALTIFWTCLYIYILVILIIIGKQFVREFTLYNSLHTFTYHHIWYAKSILILYSSEISQMLRKRYKMTDFQNAVIPQWVGRFLRSTPEMKATDAYVPFLLSKPLNKNEILELSWDINWQNINCDFWCWTFFSIYISW